MTFQQDRRWNLTGVPQTPQGPPVQAERRRFLMLQGPHGPFLAALAERLTGLGHDVWRAAFNRGDEVFWFDKARLIPCPGTPEAWPGHLSAILARHAITDLVLYGDTRPIHAQAVVQGRAAGLRIHVFEEGYLRPYWITYERDGANGNSRLMHLGIPDMAAALGNTPTDAPRPPARWGEMAHHVAYGALYHFFVMAANRAYPAFRPHRALSVMQEFRLSVLRLLRLPLDAGLRRVRQGRIQRAGFPYHVGLLQLDHDASFRSHSAFGSTAAFIELCARAFARGAAVDHHLVFKAHPLDDGRVPCAQAVAMAAQRHGLTGRLHYLPAGKLGALLDGAVSAVTVNSTSAQQVLWRGLPLKALGRAVYCKTGLVSRQPLARFFAAPDAPDPKACAIFRQYLLLTSQVPGGYYSARGRRLALGRVVALMLAPHDPYRALDVTPPAPTVAVRAPAPGGTPDPVPPLPDPSLTDPPLTDPILPEQGAGLRRAGLRRAGPDRAGPDRAGLDPAGPA
jgi:capsular polysaccharide export protein